MYKTDRVSSYHVPCPISTPSVSNFSLPLHAHSNLLYATYRKANSSATKCFFCLSFFSHMLPILLSSNRDFNRDRAPIWRNMNLAFKRRKPCVSSRHCFSVGMLQFVPEPSRLFWCELDHHNLPFTHMLFNPICILFLASFLFTQILMVRLPQP